MNESMDLRGLLQRPSGTFFMEAHSGLSAKIVEQAGFSGIWASGLSIASSLGVRDCNEISWTQLLSTLEFMIDGVDIPILVDGDSGFGNFNNCRRFVRKLGQLGAAGVCLEDKLFPKMNSFIGEGQPLADIDEFCGRIRAASDFRHRDEFVIVARTEALISGKGQAEARRRAHAYAAAGADAILIHSKSARPDEVLEFARTWDRPQPLVIVPTTYASTQTSVFLDAGITNIIWANHNLRASTTAMVELCQAIQSAEAVAEHEPRIAPLAQVFALLDYDELATAERSYLPATPVRRQPATQSARPEADLHVAQVHPS